MIVRVTRTKNNNVAKFQVSESLYLAIKNNDYVLQYIPSFVQVPVSFNSDLINLEFLVLGKYCQAQVRSPKVQSPKVKTKRT